VIGFEGVGRVLRTLRHLRARQLVGQVLWRLRRGTRVGTPWQGLAPTLLAKTPAVPFLPAPEHAMTDGWRSFRLLNREVVFSKHIEWGYAGEGPLWAYHLHQFDYLRRSSLTPSARRRLIFDWIEEHCAGVGWNSHSTSLRTMTWIKLMLTAGALALSDEEEEEVRASLAAQLQHLAAHLETHIGANHYLSNLLALVFAGLVFEGSVSDGWLAHAEDLRRELSEQVLADGLHYERSPMYHALLLESVLDLLNVATTVPERVPPGLEHSLRDAAARMLGALRVLTHPDGAIALFGDCAFGIAAGCDALKAYAQGLGVSASDSVVEGVLEAGGYVRLERGPWCFIASVSGPSPAHQPGHAHGDALAFELSIEAQRVVTDTGVYEYIPGALRDIARATRSHATCEVAGRDQAEFWAGHRVGGRPPVKLIAVEPGRRLEATCASWATPQTLHRRMAQLSGDTLTLTDQLEGAPQSARLVFPFAPDLEVQLRETRARIRFGAKSELQIELSPALRWRVERTPYFPEFGKRLDRATLIGEADLLTTPVQTIFRFNRK